MLFQLSLSLWESQQIFMGKSIDMEPLCGFNLNSRGICAVGREIDINLMNPAETLICRNQDRKQHPIRFICLSQNCQLDRLLCSDCVGKKHRKHHSIANIEKYIDPLARLGMNSSVAHRDQYALALQKVKSLLTKAWERIIELIQNQTKFIEQTLIYQLDTLMDTFSQDFVDKASQQMANGSACAEDVEMYVKKINFLGKLSFNDPQKLMIILEDVERNTCCSFEEVEVKIGRLFDDLRCKMNKFSFQHYGDDLSQQGGYQHHQVQQIKLKQGRQIFTPTSGQIQPQNQTRSLSIACVKDQPNLVFDSTQRQVIVDPDIKIEPTQSGDYQQIHIANDINDGIQMMKNQIKSRIRRVVVGCSRNPDLQMAKLLSLPNLQELQINWYELGKKEYLLKLISHMPTLKSIVLNCANQFDEQCSRLVPKKLPKIRKLQYGWDFLNSLRQYDQNIYFRLSPFTNRGCPLKTSVTREMVVGLKRLENVWLGDFMYFRPSNNEIPFRNIKEFTLGQTKGKYFRIPQKLCSQLKDMKQLLSLAILHVKIDQRKLGSILENNPFLKTFVVEGCDDVSDGSLKTAAKYCNINHLSIRESKIIEGSPIWDMSNLTTLILVECTRIKTNEAVNGLKKMKYLTYLNIYGNKWVTDEVIKQIPNQACMITLNIGRTSITDLALVQLAPMRQLRTLCLDCNKLSGTAIASASRHLASLQKLSLWGLDGQQNSGSITDNNLVVLAKELPSLYHLSIKFCCQLKAETFLKFQTLRFLETERSNLTNEVEESLRERGTKVVADLQQSIEEF